jgi:hypothetical protein
MASPALAQSAPAAAGAPAARVRGADPRGGAADDRGRREAALVELGWGADPRTFACRLAAYPVGGVVEVRGCVPNEVTRLHALAIAQASTALAVVDRLTVYPNLSQRRDGDFGDALRRGALTLLAGALPDRVGGFLVSAQPDGQVTVSGTVRTLDEKLAVSRQLRALAGCTCVINLLDVDPAAPALAPRAVPAVPAPVVRTEVPGTTPAAPPGKEVRHATRRVPEQVLAVTPAAFQTAEPSPPPRPAGTEGAVAATGGALPGQHTNGAVPAPSDPPAGGYVSSGVVLHKRAEVPSTFVPATAGPVAAPALPYVSSGTVIVAHAAPPPAAAVSSVPVAALKRRIEGVCGRSAHDIEVVALSENELEVRLKAASVADGGHLSAKIMGIKELARYRVTFQVRVDP